MSTPLFRNMLNAALAADLEKNEWRAFTALMMQTIGYGKRSDSLTFGRLAQLTGIRKDRVNKAIEGLVSKGLIERENHKWLDYTYTIPAAFFPETPEARFFAPDIPSNGRPTQQVANNNHSLGTYRVKTSTELNHNNNLPTESVDTESPDLEASRSCELTKPEEVQSNDYQQLQPALAKLRSSDAQAVLDLLALAIREGSIRTTATRLGFGLIKQAKQGTLNTAPLLQAKQQSQSDSQAQVEASRRAEQAELEGLKRLAALSGTPLENLMGKHHESAA